MTDFEVFSCCDAALVFQTREGDAFRITFTSSAAGNWCVTVHGPDPETIETKVPISQPMSRALKEFALDLESLHRDAFAYNDFNCQRTGAIYLTITHVCRLY